jgi:membrane-associated phospholipid phosphatase
VRIRPTEAIHFAALAALTILTALLRHRLAHPGGALLRYGALASFLLLMVALSRRASRLPAPLALVLDFYSAVFLPIVFNTLEPLIEALRGGARDDLLIAADRRLFGVDVTVWLQRIVHPRLNDVFFLFYASYYFLALSLGLILWRRDRATARRYVFTLMLCYYVSYAGYFAIPALGPRFAQASDYSVSLTTSWLSRTIADTINALEKTKFDVFPSGHTMIAIAVVLIARKRAPNTFPYYLVLASGLVISTVYCRYHYVIDVIAGAALAFLTVPLGDRLYERLVPGSEAIDFS